jgi:DNA-binding HxlR family transcriptional regulator
MGSMTARSCPDPSCGIARSLDVLGERWALLIVRDAMLGRARFSEFRAHLGVSPDILAARLASLVEFGVLTRNTYREPGEREREEYLLTDAGRELSVILSALNSWGIAHRPVDAGSRITYTDPESGAPLRVAFLAPDGHEVAPAAVRATRPEPQPA